VILIFFAPLSAFLVIQAILGFPGEVEQAPRIFLKIISTILGTNVRKILSTGKRLGILKTRKLGDCGEKILRTKRAVPVLHAVTLRHAWESIWQKKSQILDTTHLAKGIIAAIL